ncbi:unnamed protein product [Bursaphelenchus xylophilus]|uniref:(pine wood nematode) hypothetical protein n=1 Tax=Bursaphelenchus xylophilus TaxID=6326 RepID=A0A1I7SLT1_BURXY|nr:unnamed protein product [Bursaphelenchus xylophilus]CAG9129818.1 unnamed protein product [Bursaphelenchus xylophilus]
MSGSPSPYAHQNGTSVPRNQFRRQGSSYGPGHVHNMAVMVAPQKIDYSVTKGGLRSWAVLLVFILLCSALLAIFSESDDGEDNDYVANVVEEDEPETLIPETEEETEDVTPAPPDIEDAENEEEDEEQQLFSSLLQKAKDRWLGGKSKKKGVKKDEEEKDDDDEDNNEVDEGKLLRNQRRQERKRDLRRRSRKQESEEEEEEDEEEKEVKKTDPPKVNIKEEDDDDNDSDERKDSTEDDNDDDEEEEEPPKKRVIPQKAVPAKEESEENEDDDADDKSEEKEKEPEPLPRHVIKRQQKQAEQKEKEEAQRKAEKDEDDDDDEEDEVAMCVQKVKKQKKKKEIDDDDEDINDDEEEEVLVMPRTHREPKRSGKSWRQSLQAKRMAEDSKNPRKSLLKSKKRKMYPKLEDQEEIDEDDDQSSENDNDDQTEEEQLSKVEVREVAATRKKTNNYNRKAITNRHDYKHRSKLDLADYLIEKHDFKGAVQYYTEVLKDYKDSPRAHFGLGRILQLNSEEEDTDENMDKAINEYQKVLDEYDTPDELFKEAAENLIECARYRGNLHKVMTVQRELIDRFPDEIDIQTDFGITFLMMGRPHDARNIFTSILEADPQNSVALAYYGYLLKVYDHDYEKGTFYMKKGLKNQDQPILDAKFYFHLGDGLQRLGRSQEALKVYEDAVELGLFPSVYQRSTYNLDGLTARPWWTVTQTLCGKHLKSLERQWTAMREEALTALKDSEDRFKPEDAHLTEGSYKSLFLRSEGKFDEKNCRLVPTTCKLLKEFTEESRCDKGEIRINVMSPGSRLWPRCGPTNYVLEAHLGLVSPSEARIRVGKEVRGWRTGKFLIFDESFEHEMWFDGAGTHTFRIVLALELWHPEVPTAMKTDSVL